MQVYFFHSKKLHRTFTFSICLHNLKTQRQIDDLIQFGLGHHIADWLSDRLTAVY